MDAEVAVVQYKDKIKKLLDRFLEPDFEIRNDTYLNTLLSHLSGKDNKVECNYYTSLNPGSDTPKVCIDASDVPDDLGETVINQPIFTEWLFKVTNHWEEKTSQPAPTVITFTIHLASLLSKNEARFIAFNSCNVYVRLCSALKVRMPESSPSVKLAYVKLLSSFLEHKSGTEWLIATNNWQDVLAYCLAGQTIYILREGQNFMYNLLVKGSIYNKVFCSMIIEKIMLVFEEMHFTNGSVVPEVNDELLQKKLTPTLRLISHILESFLQSKLFARRDYEIPSIFLKNCHLEQNVWNVIMIGSQNQELLCDLNKVMILNYFFGLAIDSEGEIFQYSEVKKMVEGIFKLIKMHIAKSDVLNILKICHLLHYYWKLIGCRLPRIDYESDEAPLLFENQVLLFQIAPIFVLSYTQCCVNLDEMQDDLFREHFITKIFKIMCQHTLRILYSFRAVLAGEKNVFDNAQKALMYVMKSRQFYHRDRAVIVFQSLMYVLKDVIDIMKKKPETVQLFAKHSGYFMAHLDALATFVKEFDITWRESVETICVMSLSMDFMSYPNWPPKLVVQALKLVNLSIARFMSPNLALLVDRTSDSSMASLGAMLGGKLHDMDWEVRDSALEVLHTVSSIAHTKFPSFQTMVLDSELPSLMVTMCMYDSESFVRASAIKCLQEMIQVPAFWNQTLEKYDLPKKMIQILYNETEAIVRCEAASLMCRIYEHQSFPKAMVDKVDQAMVYAATSDLHWEVKSNALCYWSKAISNRLSNQGMIDGTFPSVTFSKENRKIVTLTEAEIKNRLNKVLVELSKCGCLGVLVAAMQDDCDLEVARKAVKITKTLADLLNLYTVTGDVPCTTPTSPKAVMDTFNLVSSSPTATRFSDDVINEIVNCRDVNLLANVYAKSGDSYPTSNGVKTEMKVVTPKEFLSFIQRDLDNLVVERTKWLGEIDDLGSLLDDILKTYDDSDVNAMDCY